ncbi:MAG: radical SAM protein [Epulopiscium sp.]|nr:radical SAM protein [Candidatus Epulonipiscium sp.]
MHFDSQVFRPPQEAYTPLLQVTHGCSYDKCTYCNMYDQNPFGLSSREEITSDIKELASSAFPYNRIYLVNGDPFCLSADKLTWIMDEIQKYIPTVKTFSMYASIRNISTKTDEELAYLRSRGIDILYMGVESGFTQALTFVNKGYTAKEALEQLKRLEKAGIEHSQGVMLGLLGAGRGIETGKENGKFFSQLNPKAIWFMSTTVMPKTELERQRDSGEYIEASEYERVQEIRAFLESVDMKESTYFNSIHPTNTFNLEGYLPEDKEKMIKQCDEVINDYTQDTFQKLFNRNKNSRF